MTREQLIKLLDEKNKALETWRNYVHTSRDNLSTDDQVTLDINIRKTQDISFNADVAYAVALDKFIKDEADARNA